MYQEGVESCLVCNSGEMAEIYSGMLKKCLQCGFVTAATLPDQTEILTLYQGAYFTGEEYLDYDQDKPILQKNFRKRIKNMVRMAGVGNIRSVLDVGCAYGFFGETVQEEIPGVRYLGLDISAEAVSNAPSNVEVLNQDYLAYEVKDKFTDVCMWDVIEHLAYPDRFIEKIHSDLLPGGRLWLTTGNRGAIIPRLRGRRWRMIHPPTHLHYFSSKTLSRLLNRKGFDVVRINHPFVARGWRQIFYSAFMLGKNPGPVVRKIYASIPSEMSISVNTYDIMLFMAVRK